MVSRDKARAYRLRKNYGITVEQYNKMFDLQGGKCFICGKPPKTGSRRLAVDHCHGETKRVRGLLCFFCNRRFLGRGREDAGLHRMAAIYLDREGKPGKLFDGREI